MKPSRAAWWFAATFWTLFGVISGIQVWISMITHGHSVPRLIGYFVAVWAAWILASGAIAWLAGRFPIVPPRRSPVLVHSLSAVVIACLHGVYWLFLLELLKPFDKMQTETPQVVQIVFARLPLEILCYGLVLGGATAFEMYERYRERALEAAQLETSLAEARLHALELQIQPHFLFNTMNSISSLVRSRRNDEAVTMMAGLSDVLRYALDHAGDQQVPLEDELAIVRRYLEIQHARFPDRMSFDLRVEPEARRAAVPAFLLQPLAENAVRHGIALSAQPGTVTVTARRDGDRLRLDVWSTGSLVAASGNGASGGIGLRNTRERLRHLYGDAGTFALTAEGGGVLASLAIPWRLAT